MTETPLAGHATPIRAPACKPFGNTNLDEALSALFDAGTVTPADPSAGTAVEARMVVMKLRRCTKKT
ncbi:MAG: hypothetical protein AMXMBFR68_01930 [Ignavibacteria bacterium]